MPMTLRDTLLEVAHRAPAAREEQFGRHPFLYWIKDEAHKALTAAVGSPTLIGQGSAGNGNWADICWLALMNPLSTTSATRGLYVVYLFASDMSAVFLCQGQGVTAVKDEYGEGPRFREELQRRRAVITARVPEFATHFLRPGERLDLKASSKLGRQYEMAPAYYKHYELDSLPAEEELVRDLRICSTLYELLLFRGGTDTLSDVREGELTETNHSPTNADIILQSRQARLHKRIERVHQKRVKAVKGYVCQACGFDFGRTYGQLGQDYIEAHHLTPLHTYAEGEVIRLDPHTDFAVLCANCHRMVHRKGRTTLPVEVLQNIIAQNNRHNPARTTRALEGG